MKVDKRMKWDIRHVLEKVNTKDRQKEILKVLLNNRNITAKEAVEYFLNPKNPNELTAHDVGIDREELKKAISRMAVAKKEKEKVVIFGDYDADGITATAVMWESLYKSGLNITPFIPHRERHGYGLSIKALLEVFQEHKPSLIITVDNGIVAHEAAEFIHQKGVELIITDHHVTSDTLPIAHAIVHTTKLAGAGVSWFFCKSYIESEGGKPEDLEVVESTLELATIGTVADQVPLMESNRSIVKFGLNKLRESKRVGLKELFDQANFNQKELSTHHINFIIAPRINAMGRLAHGLDSLRLLCTKDSLKAKELAKTLGSTNQERQDLTFELVQIAKAAVGDTQNRVLIVDDSEFHEGVIGLVAGKLTENYFRPSIVIGRGEQVSKGSARSVAGINIIELIRKASHLLINAGGHPMAAGFTIHTDKIEVFKQEMVKIAQEFIDPQNLVPAIDIECEINLADISWELHKIISALEPFGVENRKPLFCLKNQSILEKMTIGREGNHLKIIVPSELDGQVSIDALWFGKGEKLADIDKQVDLAFTIDENVWKNKSKLQLMVKDLKNHTTPAISDKQLVK